MKATALPLHPVIGEEYAGIEHGKHHVERENEVMKHTLRAFAIVLEIGRAHV